MNDEEQKELIRHLLNMLKAIYREQIAYQALVEYIKSSDHPHNLDEVLKQCRRDPAVRIQTDKYFHDYDELLRLSDAPRDVDLRQALLRSLLGRWKPTGKVN
jgi:hypothetical protein